MRQTLSPDTEDTTPSVVHPTHRLRHGPETSPADFTRIQVILYLTVQPRHPAPGRDKVTEYVTTSLMPSLSPEIRDILEEPITLPKLQAALNSAKAGKALGPDGLTATYYKTLLPSLGQYLVNLYNALGSEKSFHTSTLQAQISVIPKDGKDPAQCGSYHPISLLNVDLKIFTKILASRLQQHLPHLIHLDQVGFIPSREAKDNTTKVLNILYLARSSKTLCIFLGTDAKKAFDRVNWQFVFDAETCGSGKQDARLGLCNIRNTDS